MPLTALLTGNIDYSQWKIVIANGAAEIGIGSFVNALINFFVIAFSIFFAMKYINKINKKLEELNKQTMKTIKKKTDMEKNKFFKKAKRAKEKEEEKEPEPETKVCPYCLSEVPYKATKCAHCTSELDK